MADIFNRNTTVGDGVFLAEEALMTISGANDLGTGAMVQSVQARYAMQFAMNLELGSNSVYPTLGRPTGTLTIGKLVSNKDFAASFYDPCSGGKTVSMQAKQGGCGGGATTGSVTATMNGTFVVEQGYDMSTADMLVRASTGCVFVSMSR